MLRVSVCLCVLAAAALAQEDFFEEYGIQKIFTTCFGEELYYRRLALFEEAKKYCLYQPVYIPGLGQATNTYDFILPGLVPPQVGYVIPAPPVFPTVIPTGNFQTSVIGKGRKTRQVGGNHPLFVDRDTVLSHIDVVHAALSNYTCVLRSLDVIDGSLNIRLDSIARQYYQTPIDSVLVQDMLEGLELCFQLSRCLPVDKTSSPLPPSLQRILFFGKCERKQRIANCFKHDLRRNLFRFDLSALPEGGHSTKLEKLAAILIGVESVDELQKL